MKVLVMSAGYAGPDHYRVSEPVRAVKAAESGVEVTITRGLATTVRRAADDQEPQVVDVDTEGADVVVLQMPKTAAMLQTLRLLQARGVAVVVEMDDLLSAVAFGALAHEALIRGGKARWAAACAREADLVTTSTPALLAEYARHGRGAVVANAVPRRVAELPPAYQRESDTVTIGWTGTVLGHPYDLQEVGSGLQQTLDRTRGRSRFLVLGQKGDARERMRLAEEPAELPWMNDVDSYTRAVGEVIDIGIAPLRTDRFNTAKSWLKPLEYAARGVLCVRSRTAEYERLGLGLPAKAPTDWARWLTTGVLDADRRREMAAEAHERVLAQHLTEHRVEEWLGAWRTALDHRARARRTGAPGGPARSLTSAR